MTFVAKIEARAYSRATELAERVESAMLNLIPEEHRKDAELEVTTVEGHSCDEIQIIIVRLNSETGCDDTLDHLFTSFDSRDRRRVHNSLLQRLNSNCLFFLRIDKQAAFLNKITLAEGPDVIHVRIDIKRHPKCRQEDAKTMLESRLQAAGGID
ncbi:MAG: RNA-binding domain-containing protein [Candidatus Thorarchaeota archaeon]